MSFPPLVLSLLEHYKAVDRIKKTGSDVYWTLVLYDKESDQRSVIGNQWTV
jgi:hypothetical protein